MSFSPASVTVTVGQTVSWRNDGGSHNVVFEDQPAAGQPLQPAPPEDPGWAAATPPRRTFDSPGSFRYFCTAHRAAGMTGTVVVAARPRPELQAPRFSAVVDGKRFCAGCPRPGVVLRFNVRRAGLAIGYLKRRPLRGSGAERAFGTIQLRLERGRKKTRITKSKDGKRLTPGRYRLDLLGAGGGGSSVRGLRFTITP